MGSRKMEAQVAGLQIRWQSERCKTCAWSDKQCKSCDYMLRTGRARSRICPPGDACTVYEPAAPGENWSRLELPPPDTRPLMPIRQRDGRESAGRRGRIDADRARSLWREGLSDGAIARELGVSSPAIQQWRQREGLKAHSPGSRSGVWSFREEDARALHAQGLSDGAIARALGVHRKTVSRWRYRRELPCNFERGKKVEERSFASLRMSGRKENAPVGRFQAPTAAAMPRGGKPEKAAGGPMRASAPTGEEQGRERGAKKRGRKRAIPDERALELYRQGLSDKRIARLIGASDVGVLHWRRRNGLPPNFPSGNGKEGDGEGRE